MTRETWKIDEIKDIDNVVETFNGLVAQLCRDSSQLGELYVRAERKAARYALLNETVIDSMTSGVLAVEATSELSLVNSAARTLLGIDPREEVLGKRLSDVLGDAAELETLIGENLKTGANASRRTLAVKARNGRSISLGASTSCVKSDPARVDAVIVVFTDLGARTGAEEPSIRAAGVAGAAGPTDEADSGAYLRGVLDCYDHFSAVVREVERLQAKLERGALAADDVTECGRATRRAWEMVTAFALSLVAREAMTELADPTSVITTVLGRRKEFEAVKAALAPAETIPSVRTVRKVLEAGLELLLLGTVANAQGGVTMMAGPARGSGRDAREAVEIEITESRPLAGLAAVGPSLREYRLDQDLRREAGLMLLRSLPPTDHSLAVDQRGEATVYRIVFAVPLGKGAGPAAQKGGVAERGPDEV